jgi:hypothetical protein
VISSQGNDLPLTLSARFVDRDMFMRYRGGGIGHKYMREIEERFDNMSLERNHWNRSKPRAQDNDMDVDAAGSEEEPEETVQSVGSETVRPGTSENEGDRGPESEGARAAEEDEEDGEWVTVGPDDPSDEGFVGSNGDYEDEGFAGSNGGYEDEGFVGPNGDYEDDEGAAIEGDLDELGSDAGYESYGLADP